MSQNSRREEQRNLLRTKGLRATPARVAILAAIESSTVPITHQELTAQLDSFGLDKSTIFRGLQDLTEAGLLRRLELGDHVWRYELSEENPEHDSQLHPHLLCVDCGNIRCLNDSEVQVQLSPELGQVVDVLIKGHCPTCLAGNTPTT
jgi:Fur family transcriptional regulator, ferric uptake regulator